MNKVLHLDSSLFAAQGVSTTLGAHFVAALREHHPALEVTHHDLAATPLPALDTATVFAFGTPAENRDADQQAAVARSDALIAELREADLLVIGAPMYNFAIPAQLKTWFDLIARAGETFRYTEQGPVGLLEGKRAVAFLSRGGIHRNLPEDTVAAYLTSMLPFIGITDIHLVYAEGLNLGDEARAASIAQATEETQALAAELAG
ncbi:FMN-dependent NADH-azoreductase [Marichromatium purpuratum 984]|uniref:FMN dependent NADH:quinone oxidoreductase n=1 Tax=Marichromatium purpuratum 984 TaxID=765910 RepID=W0E822_MARPU|nr:NAD(P)H-dependent oxidoreductase [Marichromatium purpuratum]AHF05186.1 FMN-dependent NADH-azoreductase [Marichromatium purpuratum 984]